MRKITSLLMLFCAFVGSAWAQLPEITTDISNPIYYTIYNTRSQQPGGLMYFAGENVGIKDGCTSLSIEDKYKFFFTGSHDALYVHNAATGLKLAKIGDGYNDLNEGAWTAEGAEWQVITRTDGNLAFGEKGVGVNDYKWWNECNYNTGNGYPDFTSWTSGDEGSAFVIEPAESHIFPETDKFYVIECPLFFSKQGIQKGLYVNGEGALGWNTVDLTDKNYYWVPTVNNDGTVTLKNLGTGKYLNGTEMSDVTTNASLNYLGAKNFNIVVNNVTMHAYGHGNGLNASGSIVNYGGVIGSASAWTFVERENPDAVQEVTVNYSFVYGGVEKYTQTTATLVGEEYPTITVAFPYGVSAVKPAGVIEEGDVVEGTVTKTIELTVNLPFVAAADYASIQNWYYIQMHSNPQYTKYIQAVEGYIEWADATVNASEVDSYTWGFIGNPFDGFKLVNYANGETKGVNSTGSGNPAMGDIATATAWTLKPSASNPTAEYFCFQYPGSNQYMNAQGGKVAFWESADNGSTMWVTERDLSGATELQAVIDQVEAFVAAGVNAGTTVGYITSESVTNVATALQAAKDAVASKTGCIEAQVALQAAVAAVETIQPEEGKFYTIQNIYTNKYMNVENGTGLKVSDAVAMGNVFTFEAGQNGTFYMKNVERGSYVNTALQHGYGQNSAAAANTQDAKVVTISNLGKNNQVSIVPNGGATLHNDTNYGNVVAWNGGVDSKSAWVISEVSIEDFAHVVTVGEAGYSTLVLGYNAVIPAEVEAYAVSATDNGYATLTQVEGVLGAGEAVVLKNAGTYNFKYTTETATEVASNLLVGTVFNTNVATEGYVLSKPEGKEVGFYKAELNVSTDTTNDGTQEAPAVTYEAWLNNAFKAYLPATVGSAQVLRFNFGGNTTAIESVVAPAFDANAPIYDLSGRRVNAATKGIYIQNGKKFIVK